MNRARTKLLYVMLAVCATAITPGLLSAQGMQQQANPISVDLQNTLAKVDQSAQAAAMDIARLRIEKWKADSSEKRQAQSNAESLQRNMTAALPTLTSAVRTAPQDMAANFKLYRNLSALNDVLKSLTESAGAFG